MNRVFISYSRRNRTFAERLARDLSDAGLEVWVDFRQIHAGEMWEQEIYRGLERAEIVVLCLSPDAVTSQWVQREVEIAREQSKFIIPVMAVNALDTLEKVESMRWLLQVQFINFENNYESAFPDLLRALPGKRRISAYDSVSDEEIPNPFKGLEAFQQTDAAFFFGRENLIAKSLERLKQERTARFLAVVGASGSGKSSLVRAGVLPAVRAGRLPHSEQWRIAIFTPGDRPITALANRLSPLIEGKDAAQVDALLHQNPKSFNLLIEEVLADAPPEARILLVIDQFEEVFTRATDTEAENFLNIVRLAVTDPVGRAHVLITMRADFFDRLTRYPDLAELFEQENMVIVTEMNSAELLRTIEGPAQAVGLVYDAGLPQRILEEVRRQPGSLPLLQYALKDLFQHRQGRRLTIEAYEQIGGVQRALAQHAEQIYAELGGAQQAIMRRVLLRLVEISETGEATRRRVAYDQLKFRDVPAAVVQELLDKLTASDARLLIASRQITARGDDSRPQTFYEVSHEALIREWDRLKGWIADNLENLRIGSEILQSAGDWQTSNYDTAYLLTGTRLTRAEAWLDEADATPIQREFMQASLQESERQEALDRSRIERELALQRKAATRLRFALVALVIGLIAVAVLAGFAIVAQQEAESQRIEAELQRTVAQDAEQRALFNLRRAVSLSLSASANRELDAFNTEQAAKLAVNAALIDLQDADIPEIAERTLADVVYRPGTRFLLGTDNIALRDVTLSPDGMRAYGAASNVIVAWDVITGQEIGRWLGVEGLQHTAEITAIAHSPTQNLIASADVTGRIILWDSLSGMPSRVLDEQHTGRVNSLAFNGAGNWLVSGGFDQTVIVWSLDNSRPPLVLREHTSNINAVAINTTGTAIASAGEDNRIGIWRIEPNLTNSHRFLSASDGNNHEAPVRALNFPPDSNLLASGDANGIVILWNFSLSRVIDRLNEHDAAITRIAYDRRSNTLFISDASGLILRWNVSPPRRVSYGLSDHRTAITGLVLDSASSVMVSGDNAGVVRVWDIQNSADAGTLNVSNGRDLRAAYGADDRVIFTTTVNGAAFVWDAATGFIIQNFDNAEDVPNGRIDAMAFSMDGQTALTAHGDNRVIVWDVASGLHRRIIAQAADLHAGQTITAAALFPDNSRAVTGDTTGLIVIWSLETGEALAQLLPSQDKDDIGHNGTINAFAVHPTKEILFSASADGTLILWDTQTGTAWDVYEGHNNRPVTAVSFHPNGNYALSGANDGRIILWNTSDGLELRESRQALIKRFDAHNLAVNGVAFSPVRPQFATVSADGTLVVWDIRNFIDISTDSPDDEFLALIAQSAETAQAFDMRVFEVGQNENFLTLQFSQDGRNILTGLSNGQARRWRAFPFTRDLLGFMAANRFVEELTSAEIELYQMDMSAMSWDRFVPPPQVAASAWNTLEVGQTAMLNSTDGLRLNIRAAPGDNTQILFQMDKGDRVTIIDGPQSATGLTWWQIRTEAGEEGWIAGSVTTPRPVQILVPGFVNADD